MSVRTIAHGEFAVTDDPAACMGTILGPCVATVIFDPARGVGGVNHLLLPVGPATNAAHEINLMELLINGVLAGGGVRAELRAKVFGGGSILPGLGAFGARNVDFALAYMAAEGIPCVARSCGGGVGRRLQVWPATGRVRQRLVDPPTAAEGERSRRPLHAVEVFDDAARDVGTSRATM
ncbi:MAG: chemotaxis protein CheD [Shimia sp.]